MNTRDDVPRAAELYFNPSGGKFADVGYRVRCSEGHELGAMQPTVRDVYCEQCAKRYETTLIAYRL